MKRQTSFTRRRAPSVSSVQPLLCSTVSAPFYSNVSAHRSRYLEVLVYSPEMLASSRIAVYGEKDQVRGQVTLHPGCPETGRIQVTVEGSFVSVPESPSGSIHGETSFDPPPRDKRKTVFLTTTRVINVQQPFLDSEAARPTIRETFGPKRRPSVPTLRIVPSYSSETRAFQFALDLPRGARPEEDMPASFSSSQSDPNDPEPFEIVYSLTVSWQSSDLSLDSAFLDIPIMIHSDRDFASRDVRLEQDRSWLEMPLRCDRPAPYRCAVTLPTELTFSRPSSIPFFVVFTTTPRSTDLAREITSDATISITLHRQITITETPILPPTPPLTPHTSSGSDESYEISRSSRLFRLKRAVKSTRSLRSPMTPMVSPFGTHIPAVSEETPHLSLFKDLPSIPLQTVWVQSRLLHTEFSPGFPKRPRLNPDGKQHPLLEEIASLPDGLLKSKIPLESNMIQSINWPGISVKYYLEVSVLIRQEDLRVRVPIRIH